MSGIGDRVRGAAITTVRDLRELAGRGRGRIVMVVGLGVAAVLAVGIGWGVAGGNDPSNPTDRAGSATGIPGSTPGPAAGSSGTASPAPAVVASGTPGGDGTAPADSGPGGDNAAPNRPPVIDSPGIFSNGLELLVIPSVSDPDGDDLRLNFIEVDGAPVDHAVVFDPADVGFAHDATVTIQVTDSRGATTRETFTHHLAAIARVAVLGPRFRVANPQDCFRDSPKRLLYLSLTVSGAVNAAKRVSGVPISEDRPVVAVLLPGNLARYTGEVPPPLTVRFHDGSFNRTPDPGFAWTHGSFGGIFRQDAWNSEDQTWRVDVERPFFTSSADCSGYVSFTVRVTVE